MSETHILIFVVGMGSIIHPSFIDAGIIQWILSSKNVFANVNESAILTDMFVGFSTGIIGGLFVQFYDHTFCLSGIFLGTLYCKNDFVFCLVTLMYDTNIYGLAWMQNELI